MGNIVTLSDLKADGVDGQDDRLETLIRKPGKSRGPMSSVHRERIGASNRGKRRSPEIIEMLRRQATGRTHSVETRQKIGEASRGRVCTDTTRQLLSAAALGRKNPATAERMKLLWRDRRDFMISSILTGQSHSEAYANRGAKISRKQIGRAGPWRGKARDAATRLKIATGVRRAYAEGRLVPGYPKGRWREYLDRNGKLTRLRSNLEVTIARRLDELDLTWYYEPHALLLDDGRTYTPDFWITEWQCYIEVKGEWHRDFSGSLDKVRLAQNLGHTIEIVFGLKDLDGAHGQHCNAQ